MREFLYCEVGRRTVGLMVVIMIIAVVNPGYAQVTERVGHRMSAFKTGLDTSNPVLPPSGDNYSHIPNFGTNPGTGVPPHGLLIWLNDDSQLAAPGIDTTWTYQTGGTTYKLYYLPTFGFASSDWEEISWRDDEGDPTDKIAVRLAASGSGWSSGTSVQAKPVKLYVARYSTYWVEHKHYSQNQRWEIDPEWDYEPPTSSLFNGFLATIPIGATGGADASIDNRLICVKATQEGGIDPNVPLGYPSFGNYTYSGGLFVGRVPWYYGDRTLMTSPDLSGVGRTLLRFKHDTSLPGTIKSAAVSLVYHSTPDAVKTDTQSATSDLALYSVPDMSYDWAESTVTWAFLETADDGEPWFSNSPLDGTVRMGSHSQLDPTLGETSASLSMRSDKSALPIDWRRVTIPVKNVGMWEPSDSLISFIVGLTPEHATPTPFCWYYFFGKEYDGATAHDLAPRLWILYTASQ